MNRPNEHSKPLEGDREESYHPADLGGQYAKDLNKYIDYLEAVIKKLSEADNNKSKLFLVVRPSFAGTTMPVYYYVLAKDEAEARFNVEMKWGTIDDRTKVKELNNIDLKKLVIATNFFG